MLSRDGRVKLADLGLARSAAPDASVTSEGAGLGTPHYMAPEQSQGAEAIDCRADIYALGITLYHMLTGALPFTGETSYAVVLAHVNDPLPDPRAIVPELPGEVCELLLKMCAKEPEQRYQSPAELLAALRAVAPRDQAAGAGLLHDLPTVAVPTDLRKPARRTSRALLVTTLTVAVLAAAVGISLLVKRSGDKEAQSPVTRPKPVPIVPALTAEERRLKELLDYAIRYAREHPDEHEQLVEMFRNVEREAEGTTFALMAQTEIRKVETARSEAACHALAWVWGELEKRLEAGRVPEAFAALREFPEALKTDPAVQKLSHLETHLRKRVAYRFEALKTKAKALAGQGEVTEARKLYEQARGFGIPDIEKAVEELLKDLAKHEAIAEQQRRKQAERDYGKAFKGVLRLAGGRQFDEALNRCDELAKEGRFGFLANRMRADRSDIDKAKSVYGAALAALADRVGQQISIDGIKGTLDKIEDGHATLAVGDEKVTRPLSGLSGEQIAGLAAPAMQKWGGEGIVRLAVFWLCQGDEEAIAVARRHLAEAEEQDFNVQRYVELCDRLSGSTTKPEADKPRPHTEKELRDFRVLYEHRIKAAASPEAQSALAREMLAASKEFKDGMNFLTLDRARNLAVTSEDTETAVATLELLVALKTDLKKAFLAELLDQRMELLAKKTHGKEKELLAKDREVVALCKQIIDNAIGLCRWRLADFELTAAQSALKHGLTASTIFSATQTLRLRHYEVLAEKMVSQLALAQQIQEADPKAALWAYLAAGAFTKAATLTDDDTDESLVATIEVRRGEDAAGERVFRAAKAWESRAETVKGPLRQIRLIRAADLYERRLAGKRDDERGVAKTRLQAISAELGEMFDALRKPAEWVYLVDYPIESSRVGWGHLGIVRTGIGIAGRRLQTGFKAHAYSRIVFDLEGRFRALSACFGMESGAGGAAKFCIVCDGKKVYESGYLWRNHTHGVTRPAKLNIVGVDKLELISSYHRNAAGAWSAWGDPKIR